MSANPKLPRSDADDKIRIFSVFFEHRHSLCKLVRRPVARSAGPRGTLVPRSADFFQSRLYIKIARSANPRGTSVPRSADFFFKVDATSVYFGRNHSLAKLARRPECRLLRDPTRPEHARAGWSRQDQIRSTQALAISSAQPSVNGQRSATHNQQQAASSQRPTASRKPQAATCRFNLCIRVKSGNEIC